MSRVPAVAAVGMATVDHLYTLAGHPAEGSENRVLRHDVAVGGPAGRGAITAGRLGARTRLLAMCGTDSQANLLRHEMAAEPVETRWFETPGPGPHSCALLVPQTGSRTILWMPSPPADAAITAAVDAAVRDADAVLIDCTDPDLTTPAIEACRAAGIPVVLDTGSYKPWSVELLRGVDHIVAPAKFFAAWRPDLALEDALQAAFESFRPRVVAATRGERGGLYRDAAGSHRFEPEPVETVDSCGAGDAFHGALAFAVAAGAPTEQAYRIAAWAAARKCAALGNAALPTGRALEAHLASTA